MARPVVPSLPFLARLVPAAREAAPGVRAALPSRFESKGSAEPLAEQVSETSPESIRAASPDVAPPVSAANGEAPAVTVSAAQMAARPVPLQPVAKPHAPSLRSVTLDVPAPQAGRALRNVMAEPASPAARPPSRTTEDMASARREPPDAPHRPPAGPARQAAPAPFAEQSRPASEVRPPLSESTLAQRAALPRAEPQDVVQVTIDRIDVRMPSAGMPERRSSPRTRSASTVSLGEYLRQREKSRSGGSS